MVTPSSFPSPGLLRDRPYRFCSMILSFVLVLVVPLQTSSFLCHFPPRRHIKVALPRTSWDPLGTTRSTIVIGWNSVGGGDMSSSSSSSDASEGSGGSGGSGDIAVVDDGPSVPSFESLAGDLISELAPSPDTNIEGMVDDTKASFTLGVHESLQQGFVYDDTYTGSNLTSNGMEEYMAAVEHKNHHIPGTTARRWRRDEILSRRSVFRYGAVLMSGALLTTVTLVVNQNIFPRPPEDEISSPYRTSLLPKPILKDLATATGRRKTSSSTTQNINSKVTAATAPSKGLVNPGAAGRLQPVNFTRVVSETSIDVKMECTKGCISVDSKNFTKVQYPKTSSYPSWFPSYWIPQQPRVIKEISNSELLVASAIAGATTEMARTGLLYPLQTIKTRVQSDQHNFTKRMPPIQEQLIMLGTNIRRKVQEGNLYAGISPTLLVSVPATGIYYGVRDVTRRMLSMTPMSDTFVALAGALVGDVVSLCFRTPADTLAVRLQAQNETVGDWLGDSIARLPMVIATDLPYLLSKITLNRLFIQGNLSVERYAEYAIFTAIIAAILTTPFDVARTRILLDKELILDDEDEIDLGMDLEMDMDGEVGNTARATKQPGATVGVFKTMLQISREGDGGIQNLYAGWLERVLYLGIGRAWLEPIQLVGYIGIRDAILLEWF